MKSSLGSTRVTRLRASTPAGTRDAIVAKSGTLRDGHPIEGDAMSAGQEWARRVADPDDPATDSDDPRFNPNPPPKPDGRPQ